MGPLLVFLPFLVVSATAFSASGSRNVNAIAALSNRLAADLHKKLSAEDENVFFSPLSISTALGMLFYGTRGKTAEEMRRALGYQDANLADNEVHAAFQSLMEAFSKDSAAKEYLLYVANAVLAQKDFPFVPEYKNGLQNIYKADACEVDFLREGKKAVQEINNWVKVQTNNQITELLHDIDSSTIMVLLNAVYFKGTWKTQFDPKDTFDKLFFNKGLQSGRVKVPMMYLVEELPHARLAGASVLELPYKGEDISMVILLPDALDGLTALEAQLNPNMIKDIRKVARKTKMHVTLPKFKLEYEKTLNTALQQLGIQNVFKNNADLSGISKAGPIAVSKVVHKAVVEVNEEGSEASAVTGVIVETRMGGLNNEFMVNRPFLFAIVDRRNDMILFQGRVNKL